MAQSDYTRNKHHVAIYDDLQVNHSSFSTFQMVQYNIAIVTIRILSRGLAVT